jgi:hypothetical protein
LVANLTTATFALTAQAITVFAAILVELTTAAITFVGQAVQSRLVVTLSTATFSFIAQAIEVTGGAAAAGYNSLVGFLYNIGILKGR